jgi:hypothetical protein
MLRPYGIAINAGIDGDAGIAIGAMIIITACDATVIGADHNDPVDMIRHDHECVERDEWKMVGDREPTRKHDAAEW